MRLFTAVALPKSVKKELGELLEPIEGVRWQKPGQFHMTLRFIGDVDYEKKTLLENKFDQISLPPFKMDLAGVGVFPHRRNPRVIWAGVEEEKTLLTLQSCIESVCRECGLKPERRKYHPHVTLGKVKGEPGNKIDRFLQLNRSLKIEGIPISEFILYSSKLTSGGAKHKPEARFILNE